MKFTHPNTHFFFTTIAALILMVLPSNVRACSCAQRSHNQHIAYAHVIFSGTVTHVTGESGGRCGNKTANVTVNQQWKGSVPKTIEMPMSDGCTGCGMYLNAGATYLIYGELSDKNKVYTGMCNGSHPIRGQEQVLKVLDNYKNEITKLDKEIQASPTSIIPLMTKISYLLKMEDYRGAYVIARKASQMTAGERNPSVWRVMGQSLEGIAHRSEEWGRSEDSIKQYAEAMEAYKTGVHLSPNDKVLRRKLQFMQLKAGDTLDVIFPDKDASGMDFSGRKLEKVTFSGFNMKNANFKNAILKGVVFNNTNLEKVNFNGAQFSDVSFINKTNLAHVTIVNAQFEKVLFDAVDIKNIIGVVGVTFHNSVFRNLTLDNVKTQLSFQDGIWENIIVRNSDLTPMSFKGTMKHVRFLHSDLSHLRAMPSTFDKVIFEHSNLTDATFSQGDLTGARFSHTKMREAKFNQARLDKARFEDTDLTQASFYAAGLQGVIFKNVIMPPVMHSQGAKGIYFDENDPYSSEHSNRNGESTLGQTNFYMSVYDCATSWPPSFYPEKAGAVLTDKKCARDLKPLDMHRGSIGTFNYPYNTSSESIPGREQSFTNGIFKHANMQEMILRGINFDGADFTGADLSGSELTEGSFLGADFTHAKLEKVNFTMSRYDCNTIWPKGFDYAAAGAVSVDAKCAYGSDLRTMKGDGKKIQLLALTNANMEGVNFGVFIELQALDLSGANMAWTHIGNATFKDVILTKTDFSNAQLSATRFQNSNLADAILTNTIMDRVDLTDIDLRGSDHQKRKMNNAILINVKAEGVNFENASLRETDFSGAHLKDANFARSDMTGAKLQNPHYSYVSVNSGTIKKHNNYALAIQDISYLPRIARITEADFSGANLTNAYLGDADFSSSDLNGAILILAQFGCGAKWPNGFSPTAHGAVLEESCANVAYPPTDLSDQDLSGMSLAFYNLKGANLTNANLSYTDLRGTNLTDANLDGTQMLFATYDCSTQFPTGYDPAKEGAFPEGVNCKDKSYKLPDLSNRDLQNKEFSNRYLVGINLSHADLRGASFLHTDLSHANLSGAKLQGADLYGVTLYKTHLKGALYDCSTQWSYGFIPDKTEAINVQGSCAETAKNHFDRRDPIENEMSPHSKYYKPPFRNKDITAMNFEDRKMNNIDFSYSKANWTEFRYIDGADFSYASLRGTRIHAGAVNTNFKGADLSHAEIRGNVSGANFQDAILKNVRFSDYNHSDTLDLTGAIYDCRTFWGSDLQHFDPRTKGAILDDKECHNTR